MIQTTPNFGEIEKAFQDGKRGVILEGGSRSGKTWSIIQWMLFHMLRSNNLMITSARDHFTNYRRTVWADIKKIYPDFFAEATKNETLMTLRYGSNMLRAFGTNDDIMATHGLTQDILHLNEAMNISRDTRDQLFQRTGTFWIVDYNPSEEESHWYDLAQDPEVHFHKSTVLDNAFVSPAIRKQILSYEPTEQNKERGTADLYKWKVYGLGERASGETTIFTDWQTYKDDPAGYDLKVYGLDFGFAEDPTVVIQVIVDGHNLYLKEILWEHALTNPEIATAIKERVADLDEHYFVCDSAEPKSITELRNNDISAIPADKGVGSVVFGIKKLKNYRIFVNEMSKNLTSEFRGYKWKVDKNGKLVKNTKGQPIPVGGNDHGIDAARYALTKFAR